MAYSAGDVLITVRGNLAPSEIWTNTWAFEADGGAPDVPAVITALRTFYTDLSGTWFPTEYTAVGATVKDLFTGFSTEASWTVITGVQTDDILPTQLAVRLSLSGPGGVQGGPFICGWNKATAAEDGFVDNGAVADLITAVTTLDLDVLAADFRIGINRPTTQTVVAAQQARVGKRFDVIRKRSNNNAEAYSSTTLG